MELAEAYKLVLDDLSNCRLFCGHYDAKNGSSKFMAGVNLVMEAIAIRASEEDYLKFSENFLKNMQESIDKLDQA